MTMRVCDACDQRYPAGALVCPHCGHERVEQLTLHAWEWRTLPPPERRKCDVCGAPAVATLPHSSAGHTFRCAQHTQDG